MKYVIILLTFGFSFSSNAQIWDFDEVRKLDGTINSESEESIPIFSKDSSALFFIRSFSDKNKGGYYDQDIWVSYLQEDGSYSDCKQVSSLNTKYNNGVVGLSKNNSGLFVLDTYEGKRDLVKGLAFAPQKGSSFGDPEKVEIPTLDIEGDFYGFHVSDDENVILISYKGPGTHGEEDIYVSLKENGAWTAPVNLGTDINTAGFEMSPFLSPKHDTLFFASNGHGGMGDADIFYAVNNGSWTSWKKPVNLGPKINSPKFDACFSYSDRNIYWASNRDTEMSDIYTARLMQPPPLTASLSSTDVTVFEGKDGTVDLKVEGGVGPYTYAWSNGELIEDLKGIPAGMYTVVITDARNQQIVESIEVREPEPLMVAEVTASDYPNLEFKHYFDYNKNKLNVKRGELKDFIKAIEDQLDKGRQNITLRIYSSASHVPTQMYGTNEKLTQIRAENMKYDLINHFERKKDYRGKVNVSIVSYIVDGPEYTSDPENMDKYRQVQFVGIKTE